MKFWDLRTSTPAAVVNLSERAYSMDTKGAMMVVATADKKVRQITCTLRLPFTRKLSTRCRIRHSALYPVFEIEVIKEMVVPSYFEQTQASMRHSLRKRHQLRKPESHVQQGLPRKTYLYMAGSRCPASTEAAMLVDRSVRFQKGCFRSMEKHGCTCRAPRRKRLPTSIFFSRSHSFLPPEA